MKTYTILFQKKLTLFYKLLILGIIAITLYSYEEEFLQQDTIEDGISEDLTIKAKYTYPYDRIKGYWKLQTPLSSPKTVGFEDLKTYKNSSIYQMNGSHVQFKCPANGKGNFGSNPRTELRQLKSDGKDYNWSSNSSTEHKLSVKFKVVSVQKKGAVSVSQFFCGGDQIKIEVRRQNQGKKDEHFDVRLSGDGVGNSFTVFDKYKLNKWVTASISVKKKKVKVVMYYKETGDTKTYNYTVDKSSCYFKAGAYVLKKDGDTNGTADVRFASLKAN